MCMAMVLAPAGSLVKRSIPPPLAMEISLTIRSGLGTAILIVPAPPAMWLKGTASPTVVVVFTTLLIRRVLPGFTESVPAMRKGLVAASKLVIKPEPVLMRARPSNSVEGEGRITELAVPINCTLEVPLIKGLIVVAVLLFQSPVSCITVAPLVARTTPVFTMFRLPNTRRGVPLAMSNSPL